MLASNALQVATINSLGDFILFLGKCFVTAVTGSVGLYFFRTNEALTFYAAPTLLVCIFAFFVAHCVLSLYEVFLVFLVGVFTKSLVFRWCWIQCTFACVRTKKMHQKKLKCRTWG